ncbi:aldehyde dehydrogenase [Salirhabdus salicampi]|uniref:aldehyde dehydrogenase n=1 Tax=Salirhabdus salicampi TaxID=476102 RepID=UPI0020C2CD4C|nr:aldehyde dehydrogenase [Salirhabdus salicampi]MCP8616786.1 aldehyde dehydrogenase [Salirhabdus salicampi]
MNIDQIIEQQRTMFSEGKTLTYTIRKHQLQKLKQMIVRNEKQIIHALKTDLNKSEYEAFMTEITFLYAEINEALKLLWDWMTPEKRKTPLLHQGAKSFIYKEPYGVTLIIGPWNYPFHLMIAPLIGAIAAGNTAVLKPSEYTPAVSKLLANMIHDTFDQNYITVIEGDEKVSQALLEQKFDYIFFTGSKAVGKVVMEKASRHLTPVTLELGGKSPCIVDKDARLDMAAKRVAWGKFINAGQTCVSPDYLLVHEQVKEPFLAKLEQATKTLFSSKPLQNDQYTKIVNERHFKRLSAFLQDGHIRFGGKTDELHHSIEPTVLEDITWDDPVMQDEIFGPILPVRTFRHLTDVKGEIDKAPKPLALYYFSESGKKQEWIAKNISYGGGCMNDVVMHLANPYLPFGGVGPSGMGSYHGKTSFDTFSHQKSILKQTTKIDLAFRYPNSKLSLKMIKKMFKK